MAARTSDAAILWVQKLYWQTSLTRREIARHTEVPERTVRRICRGELRPRGRVSPDVERAARVRVALRILGQRAAPFGLELKGGPRRRYETIHRQKLRGK